MVGPIIILFVTISFIMFIRFTLFFMESSTVDTCTCICQRFTSEAFTGFQVSNLTPQKLAIYYNEPIFEDPIHH